MHTHLHASLILAALAVAGPVRAWTLSGTVTTPAGVPIAGVDLDFEDRATGQILVTSGDHTNAAGQYSVSVPTANFRIHFNPARGSKYFADRVDLTISSNRTFDRSLVVGVWVSGFVVDETATGIADVDLNFYDPVTGYNYGYTGDNTDVAGYYSVLVNPSTTYDILYRPLKGDPHVAYRKLGVAVGISNVVLADVVLPTGVVVSGYVKRKSDNAAVLDANMDAVDAAGAAVTLGFDATDATGLYLIALMPGTYNVIARAPSGSGLASEVLARQVISGTVTLPSILLPTGLTITGTVRDQANVAVANANLDVVDPVRGVEIPTDGDHTSASGQYSVVVGAGTYDLVYWPPTGMTAAVTVVRNVPLSTSGGRPDVKLLPGVTLSGVVTRTGGSLVALANLDAVRTSDGYAYPLQNDKSAANGSYTIRVPAGTYTFVANPPAGSSGLIADSLSLALSTNQTFTFELFDPTVVAAGDPAAVTRRVPGLGVVTPNPVRTGCAVSYALPHGVTGARATVCAVDGREVWQTTTPVGGQGELRWDGRDSHGHLVPRGTYLLRLSAGDWTRARKLLVLR